MRAPLHATIWRAAVAVPVLPPWSVAGLIWTLLGVILLALGLLFMLEGATYFSRQPPITPYIRTYIGAHLALGILAGVVLVSAAVAATVHFVLDR